MVKFLKKKQKQIKFIFGSPFVIDSVRISKKDIKSYIKGKSYPTLGDSFYFSYIYKKGVLSFVAFNSDEFLQGERKYLPAIAVALLKEGEYYYRHGQIHYLIKNSGGNIKVVSSYEKIDDKEYIDLTTLAPPDNIPDTLYLQWSSKPKLDVLFALSSVAFAASLVFFITKSAKTNQQVITPTTPPAVVEHRQVPLPDIIAQITPVGNFIEGKGFIDKVQLKDNNLLFTIKFSKEQYIQSFISTFGGKYENGQVIYATPVNHK